MIPLFSLDDKQMAEVAEAIEYCEWYCQWTGYREPLALTQKLQADHDHWCLQTLRSPESHADDLKGSAYAAIRNWFKEKRWKEKTAQKP